METKTKKIIFSGFSFHTSHLISKDIVLSLKTMIVDVLYDYDNEQAHLDRYRPKRFTFTEYGK